MIRKERTYQRRRREDISVFRKQNENYPHLVKVNFFILLLPNYKFGYVILDHQVPIICKYFNRKREIK